MGRGARYGTVNQAWVTVTDAARLMGCSADTVARRLRPYIVKKLRRGRVQNCVQIRRVRDHVVPVVDEHAVSGAEAEFRAQILALNRSQIRLARALGKLARHLGVKV